MASKSGGKELEKRKKKTKILFKNLGDSSVDDIIDSLQQEVMKDKQLLDSSQVNHSKVKKLLEGLCDKFIFSVDYSKENSIELAKKVLNKLFMPSLSLILALPEDILWPMVLTICNILYQSEKLFDGQEVDDIILRLAHGSILLGKNVGIPIKEKYKERIREQGKKKFEENGCSDACFLLRKLSEDQGTDMSKLRAFLFILNQFVKRNLLNCSDGDYIWLVQKLWPSQHGIDIRLRNLCLQILVELLISDNKMNSSWNTMVSTILSNSSNENDHENIARAFDIADLLEYCYKKCKETSRALFAEIFGKESIPISKDYLEKMTSWSVKEIMQEYLKQPLQRIPESEVLSIFNYLGSRISDEEDVDCYWEFLIEFFDRECKVQFPHVQEWQNILLENDHVVQSTLFFEKDYISHFLIRLSSKMKNNEMKASLVEWFLNKVISSMYFIQTIKSEFICKLPHEVRNMLSLSLLMNIVEKLFDLCGKEGDDQETFKHLLEEHLQAVEFCLLGTVLSLSNEEELTKYFTSLLSHHFNLDKSTYEKAVICSFNCAVEVLLHLGEYGATIALRDNEQFKKNFISSLLDIEIREDAVRFIVSLFMQDKMEEWLGEILEEMFKKIFQEYKYNSNIAIVFEMFCSYLHEGKNIVEDFFRSHRFELITGIKHGEDTVKRASLSAAAYVLNVEPNDQIKIFLQQNRSKFNFEGVRKEKKDRPSEILKPVDVIEMYAHMRVQEESKTNQVECDAESFRKEAKRIEQMYGEDEDLDIHLKEFFSERMVFTKSASMNLSLILAAVSSSVNILLEGDTGVGKTSLVIEAANKSQVELIRFNLSSSTSISSLFGASFPSSKNGKFNVEFKEGPFTTAFSKGYWLLLDEFNLAPDNVLSAIETALDQSILMVPTDTSEIMDDDENEKKYLKFHKDSNFRLFCTQNPNTGMFKGKREQHSSTLLSRFNPVVIRGPSNEEILQIVSYKLRQKGMTPDEETHRFAKMICEIHFKIQMYLKKSSEANLAHTQITLREIVKLVKHLTIGKAEQFMLAELAYNACLIYSSRLRDFSNKTEVRRIINSILSINDDHMDEDFSFQYQCDAVAMTNEMKSCLKQLHHAIEQQEPVLVTGKNGCGKSEAVACLCTSFNKITVRLYITPETEPEALVGHYAPEGREIIWKDGIITRAVKEGLWVVLENLSEAQSTVLERLNSVLESPPHWNVAEDIHGKAENIDINKNFRIIATMTPPKRKVSENLSGANIVTNTELSPALYNRFMVINMKSQIENEDSLKLIFRKIAHESLLNEEKRFTDMFTEIKARLDDKESNKITLRNFKRALTTANSFLDFGYEKLEALCMGIYAHILSQLKCEQFEVVKKFYENFSCYQNIYDHLSQNFLTEKIYLIDKKESPSRFKIACLLSVAIKSNFPCLLEGPAATGKSSLIRYLADCYHQKLEQVNNTDSTSISDYMGSFMPDGSFVDGPLVRAMKLGCFFLADEFDLAEPAVLNMLYPLLEGKKTITIPNTSIEIKAVGNFRFFATQNGSSYIGRKELPISLRSRFCEVRFEEFSKDELTSIILKKAEFISNRPIETSIAVKMSELYEKINQSGTILPSGTKLTIREIVKWIKRKHVFPNCGWVILFYELLYPRISKETSRKELASLLCNIFQEKPQSYLTLQPKAVIDKMTIVNVNNMNQKLPYTLNLTDEKSKEFQNSTESFKENFWNVCIAAACREPILLHGPTCYKSHLISTWCEITGRSDIEVILCSESSDAADLLGKIRPFSDIECLYFICTKGLEFSNIVTTHFKEIKQQPHFEKKLEEIKEAIDAVEECIKQSKQNAVIDRDLDWKCNLNSKSLKNESTHHSDVEFSDELNSEIDEIDSDDEFFPTYHSSFFNDGTEEVIGDTDSENDSGSDDGEIMNEDGKRVDIIGDSESDSDSRQSSDEEGQDENQSSPQSLSEIQLVNLSLQMIDHLTKLMKEFFNALTNSFCMESHEDHLSMLLNEVIIVVDAMKRTKNQQFSNYSFIFQDGPCTKGVKNGSILILRDINLPSQAVTERLNTLLDVEPTFCLNENMTHNSSNSGNNIKIKDSFMVFSTIHMDTHTHEKLNLSPSLRSRMTEIRVNGYEQDDLVILLTSQKVLYLKEYLDELSSVIKGVGRYVALSSKHMVMLRNFLMSQISNFSNKNHVKRVLILGIIYLWVDQIPVTNIEVIVNPYQLVLEIFGFAYTEEKQTDKLIYDEDLISAIEGKDITDEEIFQKKDGKVTLINSPLVCSPTNTQKSKKPEDFVITKSTFRNICRIFSAVESGMKLLLNGPPGIGKTRMIQELAQLLGYNCLKINFSSNTTYEDLIGYFIPKVKNGKKSFQFIEGTLTKALRSAERTWILFDEVNLAKSSLLQRLLPIFSPHFKTFRIDATGEEISLKKIHLFATKNPESVGGGRTKISDAILSNFTKIFLTDFNVQEFWNISKYKLYNAVSSGVIPKSSITKILKFHLEVASMCKDGLFLERKKIFNLRDIEKFILVSEKTSEFKRLSMVENIHAEKIGEYSEEHFDYISDHCNEDMINIECIRSGLELIYAKRFRRKEDKKKVRDVINKYFPKKEEIDYKVSDVETELSEFIKIGFLYIQKGSFKEEIAHSYCLTDAIIDNFISMGAAMRTGLTVLLQGGNSAGKTSLVVSLASLACRKLINFPVTKDTTTSDFIGSWTVSSDATSRKIQANIKESLEILLKISFKRSTSIGSFEKMADYYKKFRMQLCHGELDSASLIDAINQFLHLVKALDITVNDDNDEDYQRLLCSICEINEYQSDKDGVNFVFTEGPLVEAMKNGYWFLLDNVGKAPGEAIERLNSLIELKPSFFLYEKTETEILTRENGGIHKDFRIIATNNTERYDSALSTAFLNRCIVINLSDIDASEDNTSAFEILSKKLTNISNSSALVEVLLNVHKEVSKMLKENVIKVVNGYKYTVRNLINAGNIIINLTKTKNLSPVQALSEAIKRSYCDPLLNSENSKDVLRVYSYLLQEVKFQSTSTATSYRPSDESSNCLEEENLVIAYGDLVCLILTFVNQTLHEDTLGKCTSMKAVYLIKDLLQSIKEIVEAFGKSKSFMMVKSISQNDLKIKDYILFLEQSLNQIYLTNEAQFKDYDTVLKESETKCSKVNSLLKKYLKNISFTNSRYRLSFLSSVFTYYDRLKKVLNTLKLLLKAAHVSKKLFDCHRNITENIQSLSLLQALESYTTLLAEGHHDTLKKCLMQMICDLEKTTLEIDDSSPNKIIQIISVNVNQIEKIYSLPIIRSAKARQNAVQDILKSLPKLITEQKVMFAVTKSEFISLKFQLLCMMPASIFQFYTDIPGISFFIKLEYLFLMKGILASFNNRESEINFKGSEDFQRCTAIISSVKEFVRKDLISYWTREYNKGKILKLYKNHLVGSILDDSVSVYILDLIFFFKGALEVYAKNGKRVHLQFFEGMPSKMNFSGFENTEKEYSVLVSIDQLIVYVSNEKKRKATCYLSDSILQVEIQKILPRHTELKRITFLEIDFESQLHLNMYVAYEVVKDIFGSRRFDDIIIDVDKLTQLRDEAKKLLEDLKLNNCNHPLMFSIMNIHKTITGILDKTFITEKNVENENVSKIKLEIESEFKLMFNEVNPETSYEKYRLKSFIMTLGISSQIKEFLWNLCSDDEEDNRLAVLTIYNQFQCCADQLFSHLMKGNSNVEVFDYTCKATNMLTDCFEKFVQIVIDKEKTVLLRKEKLDDVLKDFQESLTEFMYTYLNAGTFQYIQIKTPLLNPLNITEIEERNTSKIIYKNHQNNFWFDLQELRSRALHCNKQNNQEIVELEKLILDTDCNNITEIQERINILKTEFESQFKQVEEQAESILSFPGLKKRPNLYFREEEFSLHSRFSDKDLVRFGECDGLKRTLSPAIPDLEMFRSSIEKHVTYNSLQVALQLICDIKKMVNLDEKNFQMVDQDFGEKISMLDNIGLHWEEQWLLQKKKLKYCLQDRKFNAMSSELDSMFQCLHSKKMSTLREFGAFNLDKVTEFIFISNNHYTVTLGGFSKRMQGLHEAKRIVEKAIQESRSTGEFMLKLNFFNLSDLVYQLTNSLDLSLKIMQRKCLKVAEEGIQDIESLISHVYADVGVFSDSFLEEMKNSVKECMVKIVSKSFEESDFDSIAMALFSVVNILDVSHQFWKKIADKVKPFNEILSGYMFDKDDNTSYNNELGTVDDSTYEDFCTELRKIGSECSETYLELFRTLGTIFNENEEFCKLKCFYDTIQIHLNSNTESSEDLLLKILSQVKSLEEKVKLRLSRTKNVSKRKLGKSKLMEFLNIHIDIEYCGITSLFRVFDGFVGLLTESYLDKQLRQDVNTIKERTYFYVEEVLKSHEYCSNGSEEFLNAIVKPLDALKELQNKFIKRKKSHEIEINHLKNFFQTLLLYYVNEVNRDVRYNTDIEKLIEEVENAKLENYLEMLKEEISILKDTNTPTLSLHGIYKILNQCEIMNYKDKKDCQSISYIMNLSSYVSYCCEVSSQIITYCESNIQEDEIDAAKKVVQTLMFLSNITPERVINTNDIWLTCEEFSESICKSLLNKEKNERSKILCIYDDICEFSKIILKVRKNSKLVMQIIQRKLIAEIYQILSEIVMTNYRRKVSNLIEKMKVPDTEDFQFSRSLIFRTYILIGMFEMTKFTSDVFSRLKVNGSPKFWFLSIIVPTVEWLENCKVLLMKDFPMFVSSSFKNGDNMKLQTFLFKIQKKAVIERFITLITDDHEINYLREEIDKCKMSWVKKSLWSSAFNYVFGRSRNEGTELDLKIEEAGKIAYDKVDVDQRLIQDYNYLCRLFISFWEENKAITRHANKFNDELRPKFKDPFLSDDQYGLKKKLCHRLEDLKYACKSSLLHLITCILTIWDCLLHLEPIKIKEMYIVSKYISGKNHTQFYNEIIHKIDVMENTSSKLKEMFSWSVKLPTSFILDEQTLLEMKSSSKSNILQILNADKKDEFHINLGHFTKGIPVNYKPHLIIFNSTETNITYKFDPPTTCTVKPQSSTLASNENKVVYIESLYEKLNCGPKEEKVKLFVHGNDSFIYEITVIQMIHDIKLEKHIKKAQQLENGKFIVDLGMVKADEVNQRQLTICNLLPTPLRVKIRSTDNNIAIEKSDLVLETDMQHNFKIKLKTDQSQEMKKMVKVHFSPLYSANLTLKFQVFKPNIILKWKERIFETSKMVDRMKTCPFTKADYCKIEIINNGTQDCYLTIRNCEDKFVNICSILLQKNGSINPKLSVFTTSGLEERAVNFQLKILDANRNVLKNWKLCLIITSLWPELTLKSLKLMKTRKELEGVLKASDARVHITSIFSKNLQLQEPKAPFDIPPKKDMKIKLFRNVLNQKDLSISLLTDCKIPVQYYDIPVIQSLGLELTENVLDMSRADRNTFPAILKNEQDLCKGVSMEIKSRYCSAIQEYKSLKFKPGEESKIQFYFKNNSSPKDPIVWPGYIIIKPFNENDMFLPVALSSNYSCEKILPPRRLTFNECKYFQFTSVVSEALLFPILLLCIQRNSMAEFSVIFNFFKTSRYGEEFNRMINRVAGFSDKEKIQLATDSCVEEKEFFKLYSQTAVYPLVTMLQISDTNSIPSSYQRVFILINCFKHYFVPIGNRHIATLQDMLKDKFYNEKSNRDVKSVYYFIGDILHGHFGDKNLKDVGHIIQSIIKFLRANSSSKKKKEKLFKSDVIATTLMELFSIQEKCMKNSLSLEMQSYLENKQINADFYQEFGNEIEKNKNFQLILKMVSEEKKPINIKEVLSLSREVMDIHHIENKGEDLEVPDQNTSIGKAMYIFHDPQMLVDFDILEKSVKEVFQQCLKTEDILKFASTIVPHSNVDDYDKISKIYQCFRSYIPLREKTENLIKNALDLYFEISFAIGESSQHASQIEKVFNMLFLSGENLLIEETDDESDKILTFAYNFLQVGKEIVVEYKEHQSWLAGLINEIDHFERDHNERPFEKVFTKMKEYSLTRDDDLLKMMEILSDGRNDIEDVSIEILSLLHYKYANLVKLSKIFFKNVYEQPQFLAEQIENLCKSNLQCILDLGKIQEIQSEIFKKPLILRTFGKTVEFIFEKLGINELDREIINEFLFEITKISERMKCSTSMKVVAIRDGAKRIANLLNVEKIDKIDSFTFLLEIIAKKFKKIVNPGEVNKISVDFIQSFADKIDLINLSKSTKIITAHVEKIRQLGFHCIDHLFSSIRHLLHDLEKSSEELIATTFSIQTIYKFVEYIENGKVSENIVLEAVGNYLPKLKDVILISNYLVTLSQEKYSFKGAFELPGFYMFTKTLSFVDVDQIELVETISDLFIEGTSPCIMRRSLLHLHDDNRVKVNFRILFGIASCFYNVDQNSKHKTAKEITYEILKVLESDQQKKLYLSIAENFEAADFYSSQSSIVPMKRLVSLMYDTAVLKNTKKSLLQYDKNVWLEITELCELLDVTHDKLLDDKEKDIILSRTVQSLETIYDQLNYQISESKYISKGILKSLVLSLLSKNRNNVIACSGNLALLLSTLPDETPKIIEGNREDSIVESNRNLIDVERVIFRQNGIMVSIEDKNVQLIKNQAVKIKKEDAKDSNTFSESSNKSLEMKNKTKQTRKRPHKQIPKTLEETVETAETIIEKVSKSEAMLTLSDNINSLEVDAQTTIEVLELCHQANEKIKSGVEHIKYIASAEKPLSDIAGRFVIVATKAIKYVKVLAMVWDLKVINGNLQESSKILEKEISKTLVSIMSCIDGTSRQLILKQLEEMGMIVAMKDEIYDYQIKDTPKTTLQEDSKQLKKKQNEEKNKHFVTVGGSIGLSAYQATPHLGLNVGVSKNWLNVNKRYFDQIKPKVKKLEVEAPFFSGTIQQDFSQMSTNNTSQNERVTTKSVSPTKGFKVSSSPTSKNARYQLLTAAEKNKLFKRKWHDDWLENLTEIENVMPVAKYQNIEDLQEFEEDKLRYPLLARLTRQFQSDCVRIMTEIRREDEEGENMRGSPLHKQDYKFVFLVDNSGSMNGEKLMLALNILIVLLEALKKMEYETAVVRFGGEESQTTLKHFDNKLDQQRGQYIIEAFDASEKTLPADALKFVTETKELFGSEKGAREHRFVVLISDGIWEQQKKTLYHYYLQQSQARLLVITTLPRKDRSLQHYNASVAKAKKLLNDIVPNSWREMDPDGDLGNQINEIAVMIDNNLRDITKDLSKEVKEVRFSQLKYLKEMHSQLKTCNWRDPREFDWGTAIFVSDINRDSNLPPPDETIMAAFQKQITNSENEIFVELDETEESVIKRAKEIDANELSLTQLISELEDVIDQAFPNNRPTRPMQDYHGPKFSLRGFIKFLCTDGQYKKIYENMIGHPRKHYMVAIILDVSRSMAGMAEIASAQLFTALAVVMANQNIMFALYTSGSYTTVIKDFREPWNNSSKAKLFEALVYNDNASNLSDAILYASTHLLSSLASGNVAKTIYVITDGYPSAPLKLATSLSYAESVGIHTIGVGAGSFTEGIFNYFPKFVLVNNPKDFPRALQKYYCGEIQLEGIHCIMGKEVEKVMFRGRQLDSVEDAWDEVIDNVYKEQHEKRKKELRLAIINSSQAINQFDIDLCFVLDTTGSMKPYIRLAKEKIYQIINDINEFVKVNSGRNTSLRVGFVGFKRRQRDDHLANVPLTTDHESVQKCIARQRGWGGGGDEDKEDGLRVALAFNWASARKMMVLIADAPDRGARGTLAATIREIAEREIFLFYVTISNDTNAERLRCKQWYQKSNSKIRDRGFREIDFKSINPNNPDLLSNAIVDEVNCIISSEFM